MVLLAIWPAVTSHALLEQAGIIHAVHDDHQGSDGSHEHNADNHAFADGDYTSVSALKSLKKPDSVVSSTLLFQAFSYISVVLTDDDSPGPAPPGTAPPLLQKSWCFLLRTAIPVRAPSFIS
jgi:hypothetical protein